METWATVAVALFGSGGLLAAGTAIWRAAKTAAKNEIIAEEAEETIARLWAIIDAFTRPEGES